MTFAVDDYRALVQLLLDHPEWRAELRPLILGEEMAGLPTAMERLSASIDRLDATVSRLSERVDHLEGRIDNLDMRLAELATTVAAIGVTLEKMDSRVGRVDGHMLEVRHVLQARSWFGKWLKRAEVVVVDDLALVSDALESGRLTAEQVEDIRLSDLLVRGFDRASGDNVETVYVLEASNTIDVEDVERAHARAALLALAGYRTVPLVGGEALTGRAAELANRTGVVIDLRRSN